MEPADLEEKECSDTSEYEGHVSPLVSDAFSFKEVAHDCRLTFSINYKQQDKELKCLEDKNWIKKCKRDARDLIKQALNHGYFFKYTAGIEQYNRKGEPCKLHLHLRFISNKQTASMRKQFKRWCDEMCHTTTGNLNFMFKSCVIRDETDFYGYPLKQNLSLSLCGGFTEAVLNTLHLGAKSQYIKVCEHVQNKMDKTDKKDTLYKTVIHRLERTSTKTKRSIAQEFLNYYVENELPVNPTTIKGYVLTASLHFKLTTPDELLDDWGY
jgi:hypothetical protein